MTLKIPLATSLAYGIVLLLNIVFSLISLWVIEGQDFNRVGINWDFVIRNLLITGLITGLMFRYLYLQHQFVKQKNAELRARIQALQSRIRPHFLFNSLNSIASLTVPEPKAARDMCIQLGDFLRVTLKLSKNSMVSLTTELALVSQYLSIIIYLVVS